MWSKAAEKPPSPHWSIMKPIWAIVENASERFTLVCESITTPPRRAVIAPIIASRLRAAGESTSSGLSRITRNPPALIMPACIRAETGVGASIVSGSQL